MLPSSGLARSLAGGAFLALVAGLVPDPATPGADAPAAEVRARLESGVSLIEGRSLYRARCADCHGLRGHGSDRARSDFSDPANLIRLDQAAIETAIASGHAAAIDPPPDARERAQIARFVRTYLLLPAPTADSGIGRTIYSETCSVCHGDRGDGASWAQNSLNPPPADFSAHGLGELGRQEMIDAVTFGSDGTAMMPFAVQLTRAEIAATVDYIRTAFMREDGGAAHGLGPAGTAGQGWPGGLTPDPVWGRAFYNANCAECHGRDGDGQGPRAYFMVIKPRNFRTEAARAELHRGKLFEEIAEGVTGTTMPAWRTVLSDQQIVNIGEYVYRSFLAPEPAAAGVPAPGWQPAGVAEPPAGTKKTELPGR